MTAFRILLASLFFSILVYTTAAVAADGWNLFSIFLENIAALNWIGQFNLDFSFYLILSALWIAWRHQFSPTGIVIALIASVGGMLVFAPYVLIMSVRAKGNMQELLLGK